MKRNLDHVLMLPDKATPMTYANSSIPLTMAILLTEALIGLYPGEMPPPDADEKLARFKLSLRVELGGEQTFSRKEMDVLLRVASLKCGAWLYGQVEAWSRGIDPWKAQPVIANDEEEIDEVAA